MLQCARIICAQTSTGTMTLLRRLPAHRVLQLAEQSAKVVLPKRCACRLGAARDDQLAVLGSAALVVCEAGVLDPAGSGPQEARARALSGAGSAERRRESRPRQRRSSRGRAGG